VSDRGLAVAAGFLAFLCVVVIAIIGSTVAILTGK
jgi:hypothetical protein